MFHPVHVPALRSGKVECIPCKPWDAEKLIKEGCNALVTPADQYPKGCPEQIIAATGRILEERPDLVKSFLKGMIRSYWFFGTCRRIRISASWRKDSDPRQRDPEERKIKISSAAPVDLEAMPFPIDGLATGFEDMLAEEEKLGELNYEVPSIKDVCAQDLVAQAYKELIEQKELKEEYRRVAAIAKKWGY